MLKLIYTQLWNRRKSNSWILIELLLIFCLMWYIVDYFFVIGYNYSIPSHQDVRHTWQVNIGQFSPGQPNYQEENNTPEIIEANYQRILNYIQTHPDVEEVAINFNQTYPGSSNMWISGFYNPNDSTGLIAAQRILISSEKDYFSVFRNTINEGKSFVSVRDFDWNDPNSIIIDQLTAQLLFPGSTAVGKEVATPRGETFRVAGVIDNIKRVPYGRIQTKIYIPLHLDASSIPDATISVRSKTSISDDLFYSRFQKDLISAARIGNFYLTSIKNYPQIEADQTTLSGIVNDIRIRTYVLLFFFINILLCIVGTFWYRIHVRREEIGIHKAFGSSKNNIRKLFILEGLCLLFIVCIPAMIIEYQFVHAGLIDTVKQNSDNVRYLPDHTLLRFLITNGITWLLLATTILLAIWLPASRAAAMEPVEALHYE